MTTPQNPNKNKKTKKTKKEKRETSTFGCRLDVERILELLLLSLPLSDTDDESSVIRLPLPFVLSYLLYYDKNSQ